MREEQPQPMIKVVSDVDDTLVSSGGIWPAGIDRRIPRGAMYPGAGTLFRELHRHSNSTTARTGKAAVFEAASLLLLTARPKAYKGMSENFSFKVHDGRLAFFSYFSSHFIFADCSALLCSIFLCLL